MDVLERQKATNANRHPWEQARAAFFAKAAKARFQGAEPGVVRVLDVGAGDGYVARQLRAAVPECAITCWDLAYDDALVAELEAEARAEGAAHPLHFVREEPAGVFDAIVLLDVLEHIEDDLGVLTRLVSEHLRPGGVLLFAVPAWQALFTSHDTKLRHFRRYSPGAARKVLQAAGLTVVERGGLFHSLLPVRVAEKGVQAVAGLFGRRERGAAEGAEPDTVLHGDLGTWSGGRLVTSIITGALKADGQVSKLAAKVRLPLPGLSTYAICTRST